MHPVHSQESVAGSCAGLAVGTAQQQGRPPCCLEGDRVSPDRRVGAWTGFRPPRLLSSLGLSSAQCAQDTPPVRVCVGAQGEEPEECSAIKKQ